MNEPSSSLEHAAKRPDPGLGLPAWRSWRPRNIHRPSKMNEPILDFEHAAKRPDPGLGLPAWRSWRPPANNTPPYSFKSGNATHQTPNRTSEGDIHGIETNTQLPRAYKDTYTEFCGVYSPEKVAPVRDIQRMDSRYHCPRCDNRFSRRSGVKVHYPGCIYKHGNPHALKWNDHISLKPIQQARAKDQARTDEFNRSLEAYSGIVIPSKLLPGEQIIKFVSSSKRGSSLCAICGGGPYWKATHVKSHFITCVKNHGNPRGANWYDQLGHKGPERLSRESPDIIADAPPLTPLDENQTLAERNQLSHQVACPEIPFNYAKALLNCHQPSLPKEYPSLWPIGHSYGLPPLEGYPSIEQSPTDTPPKLSLSHIAAKIRRAAMRTPDEPTMEQYLIEQYLARIGYAPCPEQQIPDPDPDPDPDSRPDMRLATEEEDQAEIPNQFKQGYTDQQRDPATISSRSAIQIRRPELREETTSPSTPLDTSSTDPWPEREASYQVFEPGHVHNSPSPLSLPLRPTETERPAGHHHSALEQCQNTCLEIERQINACQKQIHSHPSKQKKINKEHEKRIAKLKKPANDEKQESFEAERRNAPETAQEAEIEEMRNIYLQYDRGSIGVPNANVVDRFFVIVANTERHLKRAEEANKAATGRVAKLEDQLYRAKCAMFGLQDGTGSVENGLVVEEARRPDVEMSKIGGHKQGKKRKSRRRKGAKDRQTTRGVERRR